MILIHSSQQFEFKIIRAPLEGIFLLNAKQKAQLRRLVESESEDWYFDRIGERLPPDRLFQVSPWSIETAQGPIKILNRSLDLETGEALFNIPDTYCGEWFSWPRDQPMPE